MNLNKLTQYDQIRTCKNADCSEGSAVMRLIFVTFTQNSKMCSTHGDHFPVFVLMISEAIKNRE
jgi:hypothetical protein